MKWRRNADMLPRHHQEVLLRHHGILYLAVYNKDQDAYMTKDGKILENDRLDVWCGFVGEESVTSSLTV